MHVCVYGLCGPWPMNVCMHKCMLCVCVCVCVCVCMCVEYMVCVCVLSA